jgi:hypothetical protein
MCRSLIKEGMFFSFSLFKMSNVLQCPCVVCDEECHEDTISCCNCEDWVHIACNIPSFIRLLAVKYMTGVEN